jgi:hypothetical protein
MGFVLPSLSTFATIDESSDHRSASLFLGSLEIHTWLLLIIFLASDVLLAARSYAYSVEEKESSPISTEGKALHRMILCTKRSDELVADLHVRKQRWLNFA